MMKDQLGMDLWEYRKAEGQLFNLLRIGEAMISDVAEATDLLNRQARDIASHICRLIETAKKYGTDKEEEGAGL